MARRWILSFLLTVYARVVLALTLRQGSEDDGLLASFDTLHLRRRNATDVSDGSLHEEFDFTAGSAGREILLQDDDGFQITCIDCQLEGKFTFELASDISEDLQNELLSLLSPQNALIPGNGGLFDRQNHDFVTRDTDTLISELLGRFNLNLTQTAPIRANFNLEFLTGNRTIEADLGVIPIPVFPSIPARKLDFGIFEFGVVLSPLALATSVTMQPNMNVSIPFGVEVVFGQPLEIDQNGIAGAEPSINVRQDDPTFSTDDPSLCITAALGPVLDFVLGIPATETSIELSAQLQLPKISICLDEDNNVDSKCQPGGPIVDALNINSTMSIGISSEISFNLPLDIDMLLPDPPQLPQLSKEFPLVDECIDLVSTASESNGTEQIVVNIAATATDPKASLADLTLSTTTSDLVSRASASSPSAISVSTMSSSSSLSNTRSSNVVLTASESASQAVSSDAAAVASTTCTASTLSAKSENIASAAVTEAQTLTETIYTTVAIEKTSGGSTADQKPKSLTIIVTVAPTPSKTEGMASATFSVDSDFVGSSLRVKQFDEPLGVVFTIPTGLSSLERQFEVEVEKLL